MRMIVVTLSLLALAGPARAGQPCLAGEAMLGDQRDLAALATAIEQACPCAGFTGGPGADRGAYRRCARDQRDLAEQAGALRRECRVRATRGYTLATCGSADVACGRFTPAQARKPVSCTIKPAGRCADGAKFEEAVCGAFTRCAEVVDATAGTCLDPAGAGPHGVGVRTIRWTKPSAVDPQQTRTLDTVVWYPAPPDIGPVSGTYDAVIDAPLDTGGGPYPVLLFSHGSCGYPLQSTFLLPLLASWGFVVAAPPHPGNTLYDYPGCGTATAQANSFLERPRDVSFVLDRLLEANADAGSPLFGSIDPGRVGMAGHSFGGLTTHYVAAADLRVKVAIPMAAAVVGNPVLAVPSLAMLGQIDSVVNNDAIRAQYAAAVAPKFLVEIAHAGHYAFSDGCFTGPDCNPPTTLDQQEAHAAVLRWVLPFLEVHLVGDERFAPFLAVAAAPPGVVVAARR